MSTLDFDGIRFIKERDFAKKEISPETQMVWALAFLALVMGMFAGFWAWAIFIH